jgi:folate-binding protein YgfZ
MLYMLSDYRSPLLALPGAVAGEGVDSPVAAHYGSLAAEQRTLEAGDGFVDHSHRDVIRVSGPDRLSWLHALTSQDFEHLAAGVQTAALVLSPRGHVEHVLCGADDGEAFVAHVEPGEGRALVGFLESMRFLSRVEVAEITDHVAVAWRPTGGVDATGHRTGGEGSVGAVPGRYDFVPRPRFAAYADAAGPACGLWAFEALRIARGEPRLGMDTDQRTIPNEAGWIGTAVHLDKGCYPGQETVARVHNLGRPPRRLIRLHLDGSENRLPKCGSDLLDGDKAAGFVGSSARHHELGPIALGMVKRAVPVDSPLSADGIPATQEALVDPEAGLHVRPRLR